MNERGDPSLPATVSPGTHLPPGPLPAAAAATQRIYARLTAPALRRRDEPREAERPLTKKSPKPRPPLLSMPEIRRLSMAPSPIERQPLRGLWLKLRGCDKSAQEEAARTRAAKAAGRKSPWRRAARRRRVALAALVLLQTGAAAWSLAKIFPYPWVNGLEIAILALFAILFSWISFGFWTAVAGFWLLCKGDRFSVADLPREDEPLKSRAATLIPICNEEVERVFAGLEAIYRSVDATGRLSHFDFYILSDTADPDKRVEEEIAWAKICRAVRGFGRIFYRHRRVNIKRKSGNIADFLRRWGGNYDYVIVLDADSLMAGDTMVRLVQLMERHPTAGIIQTVPTTVNRESLLTRAQQFSSRAYGPMLAAGLHFWQLGESAYWGHNAILRVEPFIKHCGLSRLPGKPPLGGEILSHDFVEAALMGRAGWEVWLARDLGGSYEETPPTLLDELKRDQRWCQGNLQHLRLVFGDGFGAGHRALFSMGVMAYTSALFWALFLVFNTIQIALESFFPPVYFPSVPSLFPIWPRWHPEWAIALLSTTAALLFLPKFLSLLWIVKKRDCRSFGGAIPLGASIVLETLLSTLLAPLRMWFHAKFVLLTLLGRQIKWGPQTRDDNETGWRKAIRAHGFSTVFGGLWILGALWINPSSSWWVLPVATPLVFAAPLSVYSSRVRLGRALRRWRLFLIPEEIQPGEIIGRLRAALEQCRRDRREGDGFVLTATDPGALTLHVALRRGKSPKSPKAAARNRELCEKAFSGSPKTLGKRKADANLFWFNSNLF